MKKRLAAVLYWISDKLTRIAWLLAPMCLVFCCTGCQWLNRHIFPQW